MDNKTKDWIISVILNTTILVFPFFIALIYNEPIQEKTLTIAVAMFLMTVAIGSSEKLVFYSFFIISLFLVATYGAIANTAYIQSIYHYQIFLAACGIVALGFDKYDLHIRKGQPLNNY
jgi:hypothetical protein